MLRPIKSYFAPLTREQIEQNELTSKQAARIRHEREEEKAEVARVVASQVNNVIEIMDEDEEEVPPVPKGRNKMPNTMVGSVKKGKYSR